jgi:ketosteroid isomerase-like protein
MSQENVEIVRKAIEARNRDLEEWLSFFHPAAVTSDLATAAGMRTGEVQGRDELRRDVEQWQEVFDDFGPDIVELVDLDEWVLAEVRFRGRGGASGAKVAVLQVDLYRVCEGLITEQRAGYPSREEALDAVGLSE